MIPQQHNTLNCEEVWGLYIGIAGIAVVDEEKYGRQYAFHE